MTKITSKQYLSLNNVSVKIKQNFAHTKLFDSAVRSLSPLYYLSQLSDRFLLPMMEALVVFIVYI